jgi:hypothetical protein
MQEDEEEIQMQSDEEEIQMQPDAGGVVQRGFFDWFKKKPVYGPENKPAPPMPQPSTTPIPPRGKPLTAKGQQVVDKLKSAPRGEGSLADQLNAKRKSMGLAEDSSDESKKKVQESLAGVDAKQQEKFKSNVANIEYSKGLKRDLQREKLVSTLKNPDSTPEQLKEAEEKLRTFHKSGKFKKNPATIALKERKKALKEAARGGDQKAAELYKKENPSFLTKLGNFAGKAGDFYGKHKETIGTVMGFLGIGGGKKDEEKAPGGGGGDGGGYAVIISQLMQENKMLKEQLAKK